jgi:hypothetical protein
MCLKLIVVFDVNKPRNCDHLGVECYSEKELR